MVTTRCDSKGNNLFKGEIERADGRYEYRYTDHRGVRRSIYEARLQRLRIEEAKIAYKERTCILYGLKELSLNDTYEMWIAGKIALKETTIRGYSQIYDSFVRNSLGKNNIEDIKTVDIKAFYLNLKIERKISVETICRIQNVLFQIFQHAVDSDILMKNPATRATKEIKRNHSKHTSTRMGLNEAEANRLADYIYESEEFCDWYPVIYVLIHTGLRLSEIVSLRWCDVNLAGKYLEVNHNAVYYASAGEKARYHFSDGAKTVAGIRKIPFDKKVFEAFLMEKEILAAKNITCAENVDGYTDFVFLNRFGKMFDPCAINKALTRIVGAYNCRIEEKGLPDEMMLPHLSCHSLRHTFAIILCERGVNVKVTQMVMGHKDISTTMDIYTNVSQEFAFEEYARSMGSEGVDNHLDV